jgi:hypothetical protein
MRTDDAEREEALLRIHEGLDRTAAQMDEAERQETLYRIYKRLIRIAAIMGLLLSMRNFSNPFSQDNLDMIRLSRHMGQIGPNTFVLTSDTAVILGIIGSFIYPVALAGLIFFRRWAAVLLLAFWALHIVPLTFIMITHGAFRGVEWLSCVGLLISAGVLYGLKQEFAGQKLMMPFVALLLVILLFYASLEGLAQRVGCTAPNSNFICKSVLESEARGSGK